VSGFIAMMLSSQRDCNFVMTPWIAVGRVRLRVAHTPATLRKYLTLLRIRPGARRKSVGASHWRFCFRRRRRSRILLERAAGAKDSMGTARAELFKSVNPTFKTEPDHLQLWLRPWCGSACGKSLGAMPQSTLETKGSLTGGREIPEEEFVANVLETQPAPPTLLRVMSG